MIERRRAVIVRLLGLGALLLLETFRRPVVASPAEEPGKADASPGKATAALGKADSGTAKANAAQGEAEAALQAELLKEVRAIPYKIVFETFRETNWELYRIDPDGSDPVNLTRTPKIDELYPHVSPDGTKICFSVDEGEGDAKTRSLCYMNMDGSGRTLVGVNLHQACWSADGNAIAYLKGEEERFTYTDYATVGLFIYDLKTKEHRQHPNKEIRHLYNLCWSPDGKWFLATVHAGMGFSHAILAIEAEGTGVYDLHIGGCRPDISPDGTKVAWGVSDFALRVGDLDFSGPAPAVTHQRDVVTSEKPIEVYHVDWSPDGKHIAFSRGPSGKRLGHPPELVGIRATGWGICVADPARLNRWAPVTTDGNPSKEPDWVPVPNGSPVRKSAP